MKYLWIVLLTIGVLALGFAAAFEILGVRLGPLDGPRWVNVWQYALLTLVFCLGIAFDADQLKKTGQETIRLFSFPLIVWAMLGIFPAFDAIWSTSWGTFLKLVGTIGMLAVAVYIWYLIVRYLMIQARPGYFTSGRSGKRSA